MESDKEAGMADTPGEERRDPGGAIACPGCQGSDFQFFAVPINRHTGEKPEHIGSLLGGLMLAIVGVAMVWGGFQLSRDPDPTGPAWWQVMGFGAVALSWAGILVQPFAKMDRRLPGIQRSPSGSSGR